ncbi:MAG: type VI secretion system baseplate subunit TssF [Pseudomonadota bacterium]
MAFNKYYQDELSFLSELGKEFAQKNPKLAPFLAERGNDPDVERLLEGFAFLSGRLRQKLDDELPELTHTLIALLWPHYLRPLPAMSILQFDPVPSALMEKQTIPRGCTVDSVPVEGTQCHFKTCYDVDIYPLRLENLSLERVAEGSVLSLRFTLEPGVELSKLALENLRLFLHGEAYISYSLYLWLCRYVDKVRVRAHGSDAEFTLSKRVVRPLGFAEEEGLLPYPPNAFLGYRLLQEYFSLPEKFLFFDINELNPVTQFMNADGFDLIFHFSSPLDDQIHQNLKTHHVRLYCTPIINLFPLDASPIRLDHRRVEYRIRPEGNPPEHYEIYTVDKVEGVLPGSAERQRYYAFESFDHALTGKESPTFYRTRLRPSVVQHGRDAYEGVDTYIAFVTATENASLPPVETISIELTCSHRHLAGELKRGEICVATGKTPEFVTFENITVVTPSFPPPLEAGLHWQLISNMSLNYISLANVEALRVILSAYDFGAYYNVQTARESQLRREGIAAIQPRPVDVLHHGTPVRGIRTHIDMHESKFAGEGDMYLFASVLNEFFALYASINAFHQLEVKTERGEIYLWPARLGQQHLI